MTRAGASQHGGCRMSWSFLMEFACFFLCMLNILGSLPTLNVPRCVWSCDRLRNWDWETVILMCVYLSPHPSCCYPLDQSLLHYQPLNSSFLCSLQVVEDGYEFFAKRQLVTLFSAPNYCGEFDNAGAMMSVDETLMCSFQVTCINYQRQNES